MDPSELPAYLEALAARVEADGATPAALAMAHTFERAVKRTLSLRTRGRTDFRPKGERGQPPALRSGRLRSSVRTGDVLDGGAVASASVAPHIFYAAVQEWGHTMHARPSGYMSFTSGGTHWYLKTVNVGPNPYMRPTVAACIANGSLGRAAAEAFEAAIWG